WPSGETVRGEGGDVDGWRALRDERGDDLPRAHTGDEAHMAVAERVEDPVHAGSGPDHRPAIRDGRPMAHPELHALRREIARQARKTAQQVVTQDLGALPVRRGVEAGEFHLPRAPQP